MKLSTAKNLRSRVIYMVPLLNIVQCIIVLRQKADIGQGTSSLGGFIVTSILAFVAIGFSLRRFIQTLRMPYQKQNLYTVITVIFSIITFYAVLYSLLIVHIPNSFSGMEGASLFDNVVNTIYFSIVTFTTVGFGDIHPVAALSKMIVSAEIMSFFIFFVLLASNHSIFLKPKEPQE